MLCQFLPYSKINQLYVYIYPLVFGFPSDLGHHRALSRVSSAIQQIQFSSLYIVVYICQSQFIQPPPYIFGNHKFVLYICYSISALQISSFQSFFQIPHISEPEKTSVQFSCSVVSDSQHARPPHHQLPEFTETHVH